MNPPVVRDPQDTFLLVLVLGVACVMAWADVEYASEVVALAVGGVLTKIGTHQAT